MTTGKEGKIVGLHAVVPRTTANGPGTRFGIWFQGCRKHCPACVNPGSLETLPPDAPDFNPPSGKGWIDVDKLVEMIGKEHECEPLEGISVSGGEPFDQPEALRRVLIGAQRLGLGILVFTGHTREELYGHEATKGFFKPQPLIDILIDGAYDRSSAVEGEIKGSANQRIIMLTDRYRENDLGSSGVLECIIEPDGTVVYTGFSLPPTAIG